MAKKLTVELSPAQARSLVWAINIWEESYVGTDYADKQFYQAVKNLADVFESAHIFASENGK